MPRYTTRGDIRGRCGHWHRTLRAAVQCLATYRRQRDDLIGRLDRTAGAQPPADRSPVMTWNNPAWEGDEWAAVRAAYAHEEDLVAIEWRRAWATRLAYARQARLTRPPPPGPR